MGYNGITNDHCNILKSQDTISLHTPLIPLKHQTHRWTSMGRAEMDVNGGLSGRPLNVSWRRSGNWVSGFYPLVICYIAMENHHL